MTYGYSEGGNWLRFAVILVGPRASAAQGPQPDPRYDEWSGDRPRVRHPDGVSVFETCRRQTLSVVDHVSRTLRSFGNRLLPRPLLFRG